MSSSGGAGGGGLVATLHVPNTGINTLFSAPTAFIPAPGADRLIVVEGATIEAIPGAVGNWSVNALALYYGTSPADATQASNDLGINIAMLEADALPNTAQIDTQSSRDAAPRERIDIVNQALTVGGKVHDPIRIGALMALTIFDGGAGYVIGDTGTIDAGFYGGGATYIVDTVGALGVVTALHLTAAGTGYGQGDTEIGTATGGAQPGVGTGLEVNITTVVQPLGDLYVTCNYRIITTH